MSYSFTDYCVCPNCHSDLRQTSSALECAGCRAVYDIKQGIPVLLPNYDDDQYRRYLRCYEGIARDDLVSPLEQRRDVRHSQLVRFISDVRGKKVLDIGSSNALYLRELHAAFRVAFDIAHPYLAAIPPSATVERVCGDAEYLPFKRGFFDVIIVSDILEHVLKPERLVQCLSGICERETRVIVELPWEEDLRSYKDQKYEFTHLRTFDSYTFSSLWSGFYIKRRRASMPYLEYPIFFQIEGKLPLPIFNFLRFIYHHEGFFIDEYTWRTRAIRELPRRYPWLLYVCKPVVRQFELRTLEGSGYQDVYRRLYKGLRAVGNFFRPRFSDKSAGEQSESGTGHADGSGQSAEAAAVSLRSAASGANSGRSKLFSQDVHARLALVTRSLRQTLPRPRGGRPSIGIRSLGRSELTDVDRYWSEHTVNSKPFLSRDESERYLRWRFEEYPLFRELMGVYHEHEGEVILDFGCGPGDDVVGFLLYTNAKKVIGIDVSAKALGLARDRLELHAIDRTRVELIHSADSLSGIPLDDNFVDYINCGGVLHHVSHPELIVREFYRVLRAGQSARVMVYNRDSLWFHLYTAYIKMILEGAFRGLDVETAFSRNTDGEKCPIARAYRWQDFVHLCEAADFRAEFVGGYLARHEVKCWQRYGSDAMRDRRLGEEHREFLSRLVCDERGYPMYEGRHAGVGGVYRLRK